MEGSTLSFNQFVTLAGVGETRLRFYAYIREQLYLAEQEWTPLLHWCVWEALLQEFERGNVYEEVLDTIRVYP